MEAPEKEYFVHESGYLDESEKTRIWITSIGGLVGTYLTSYFSQSGKYYLVGSDASDYIALRGKLDAFYKTPLNSDPAYLEIIKKIIRDENIDVVIPISSHDMDLFTLDEIKDLVSPAKMLVMDEKMHQTLHDKQSSKKYLESLGIQTPQLYQNGFFTYPCVMKPNRSSGSKNIILLENESDYLYWKMKLENFSVFEYLPGKEYTVDCIFDNHGCCVGYNARERVKMNGGGAVISTCVYDEQLPNVIRKLEKSQRIKGPVNFQYKKIDGSIVVFDFNTRLASGGLPLSVKAGFPIPDWIIDLALGKHVGKWNLDPKDIGLTMIRYYQENYINMRRKID